MRESGPSANEVKTAKSYVNALYPSRVETNESISGALAELWVYGLPNDWVEKFRERLADVTPAEAKAAAAKYLPADPPMLVLVGNAKQIEPQVKGLGKVTVKKVSELK